MESKNRGQGRVNKLSVALMAIWKQKLWILFLMFAVFAVFCIHNSLHAEDSVKATLTLRYEHAYEGLNPNGSRFNINELTNDEILSTAIGLAGLDKELTVNQLRNDISIGSSGSQDPTNKYIATEYSIRLSNKHLPERISARSMLGIILQSYKVYFLDHYGKNDGVLDIDWSEINSWEYPEFADFIEVKIDNIVAFLQAMQIESGTYNYKTEGETFRSLEDSVVSFRNIYLNKYTAYVTNNNLFRNPERYRDKLEYRRFLISQASEKNNGQYKILQEALDTYDKSMITFVMIPIYDDVNGLQMSRTDTGMDVLTLSSMEYAKMLEANEEELKNLDKAIGRTWNAEKDPQKYATANLMILEMKQNLNELIQRISGVVHDYEESRYKNSISFSIQQKNLVDGYGIKEGLIVAFVVGLVVSFVYAIYVVAIKKEIQV